MRRFLVRASVRFGEFFAYFSRVASEICTFGLLLSRLSVQFFKKAVSYRQWPKIGNPFMLIIRFIVWKNYFWWSWVTQGKILRNFQKLPLREFFGKKFFIKSWKTLEKRFDGAYFSKVSEIQCFNFFDTDSITDNLHETFQNSGSTYNISVFNM